MNYVVTARNHQKNCLRFEHYRCPLCGKMTSAQFKVGVTESDSISTKVLAPPGGKTSISLYGGDEAPAAAPQTKQVNPCQAARNKSSVFGSDPGAEAKLSQQHIIAQEKRGKSSVFAEPEPLKPVKVGKSDNGVLAEEKAKQEPLHTSVQIINPPGGKSQISFG